MKRMWNESEANMQRLRNNSIRISSDYETNMERIWREYVANIQRICLRNATILLLLFCCVCVFFNLYKKNKDYLIVFCLFKKSKDSLIVFFLFKEKQTLYVFKEKQRLSYCFFSFCVFCFTEGNDSLIASFLVLFFFKKRNDSLIDFFVR